MAEQRKVVKYKRPISINLGVIVFAVVFVYLAIQIIIFLNSEQLSVYEVTQNRIADDNTYQGLIIREETVFTNEKAGYINYYAAEGERIAKKSTVYTLDESGKMYELLANQEQDTTLTKDDIAAIRKSINTLNTNYSDSNYKSVYSYKYDIENTVLELSNASMITTLNKLLKESGNDNTFSVVKSNASGIISYHIDGFESVVVDSFKPEMLDSKDYEKSSLRSTDKKEENSPIYKLITSEDWNIIIPLNSSQYENLKEKTVVRVTFLSDKLETSAGLKIIEKEGNQYGVLSLNKYMLRYLSDRYISISITSNTASGYKIPRSSVTEKEFYKIPLAYFTKGGNNNSNGVVKITYKENGDPVTEFIEAEKYYEDETFGYIDINALEENSILLLPDAKDNSNDKYQVSETGTLTGVYNVNKGYPVFKRIEKIYENEEYYLVGMNTKNGLNNFDHIILNVALAKEQHYVD